MLKLILISLLVLLSIHCTKNPAGSEPGDYLEFSNATLHVPNRQGARAAIEIHSTVEWNLSLESPGIDWMVMNKHSGRGYDSLIIFTTRDNNTQGYKFANIIATAVNNRNLPAVRLTVVQYDSTFKGK